MYGNKCFSALLVQNISNHWVDIGNGVLDLDMIEILNTFSRMRETCKSNKDYLENSGKGPLSGCFGMLYNDSTWPLEVLSYYYNIWSSIPVAGVASEEVERSRQENVERVIIMTKWAFVSVLSNIEFCVKDYARSHPSLKKLFQGSNRVYLRKILEESAKINPPFADSKSLDQWNCLLDIRNTLVHNNGVSDQQSTCEVGGTTFDFKMNTMLRGNLGFFPHLTSSAIDLFFNWTKRALNL